MSGAAEAARFLARHGMDAGGMELAALRALWLDAMERGLRGEESSMHMLPAFVRPDCTGRDGDPVLVMDAGGTNLRTALVRLGPRGVETLYFSKTAMPGSAGPLTADEFFRAMALQLLPIADRAPRACLCFSYPCRIRPDGDGELIALCKELQVTGAEGALVCARLEAALQALGAAGTRRWRLINDTVAALLEGRLPEGFSGGCGAEFCCGLADGILQRAALFAASMLAAAIERARPADGRPLCICAEGTTVNHTPTFLARIRTLLEQEVTAKGGPALEFVTLADATLAGSALAAMQA